MGGTSTTRRLERPRRRRDRWVRHLHPSERGQSSRTSAAPPVGLTNQGWKDSWTASRSPTGASRRVRSGWPRCRAKRTPRSAVPRTAAAFDPSRGSTPGAPRRGGNPARAVQRPLLGRGVIVVRRRPRRRVDGRSIRSRPTRAMRCGAVWPTSISPAGTSIAVSTNSGPAGACARCRRRRRRTTRSATTTVRCGRTTPRW